MTDLPDNIELMIDCVDHAALRDILRSGTDLIPVSLGALADSDFLQIREEAAIEGKSKLHLANGAIGALDCLRATLVGRLQSITYIGRKPPLSWKGSPVKARLDLDKLTDGAKVHFDGSARDAATEHPKNAESQHDLANYGGRDCAAKYDVTLINDR